MCCLLTRNDDLDSVDKTEKSVFNYKLISKDSFDIKQIRPINRWIKPRPGRVYQKLRFDIISNVYASSAEYIYKLPPAFTRQDDNGVLETYGSPCLLDLCSFVLCNPSWLVKKHANAQGNLIVLSCLWRNYYLILIQLVFQM